MKEEKSISCPRCGEKMKRLISGGSGFILKGSNWYKKPPLPDKKKEKE